MGEHLQLGHGIDEGLPKTRAVVQPVAVPLMSTEMRG